MEPVPMVSASPSINLDTLEIKPKAPAPQQYQASSTRLTDIIHTKLEVSFDWAKQYMYGKATITAKPYFYPTSQLVLDARGMEIKEVSVLKIKKDTSITSKTIRKRIINDTSITESTIKAPLKYIYEEDKLTIHLDKEYNRNEQYKVFIDYISKPNELKKLGGSSAITEDKGLYFINPEGKEKNKPMEIWTQGETQSNSVWIPTIDKPNERMTQEINITVDKKYTTLSNGELASTFDNGDNTRTDCWKMDLPHAPYLAMMAIGEFAVVKDKWRDKEVNYYVEKEYEPYAKAIFGNTPEMLEFFSNKLGVPFAWNKYSQVVVRDYVSGSMENTTATLHGEFMQRTDRELLDRTNEEFIAHEMFHDWFGDLVTCESWSNVPLNESFATYGEYLWEEYKYGKDVADAHSADSREGYLSESQRKEENLIRFQYDDREDMFDAHSYNKGGQVLHMLRKYVGDEAFFASLKLYLETNKFTSVEIHNLRLAFEQVTGEDLNWFFNQWFLSSGHPELLINEGYDASTKKVTVQIKQVQDFAKVPLFKLPMYIDIYVNGKAERKKITVTKADETFEFDESAKPNLINVDAEKQLLCTKIENKTNDEWAYQYKYAPLYLDRYEALTELAKQPKDSLAAAIIITALKDKFWGLRANAIEALRNFPEGKEKEIKEKIIKLAKEDEKSLVRAEALDYLILKYKDADLETVYKNALNDKSYSVLGEGLQGLAKTNPQEGLKAAKQFENEKSMDVLYAIPSLYAEYGTDENNNFFLNSYDKFKGFSLIGFISQYTLFLKSNKKDETVNSGIALFAGIAKDENTIKWVAYYAKKSIQDLYIYYEDKENALTTNLKKLKETNPAPPTQDLETQIANVKAEKEKIGAVYDGLK